MESEQNISRRFCFVVLVLLAVFGLAGAFGQNDSAPGKSEQELDSNEITEKSSDDKSADSKAADSDPKEVKAALISCKGMIDEGLRASIERRTEEAFELGATYLIYDIGTYGGLVTSADQISEYLIETGKRGHTVAYVTTKAISAGAMISVACKDIVMRENTTIGDSAPVTMGGELEGVEREKIETYIRALFAKSAQANDYPEALLKAMVTQGIEVWRVENKKTGEYEYFEAKDLPKDETVYDIENKKLIVSDTEILTLTNSEAEEYGVSRATVENLEGLIAFLEGRYNVNITGEPIKMEMLWSEQMVRWVNSPAVMSILILLAMLGVYIELSTPGLGLPGLVAVICVVIIVGSKYLVGLANWVEVAVFVLGVLLLLVEVFIIPGFGVAGIAGIICIFAGLFGMLVRNPPGEIPWPRTDFDWALFSQGIFAILAGFIGFLAAAWILAKYLPRIEFLSGLILSPSTAGTKTEAPISATSARETIESTVAVGMRGVVVSPLRPTGSVRFGETVADVVARAEFIENGAAVEIVEIHGNRVVVKKVE